MGFVPDHWGPYIWSAIHILCMGAPAQLTDEQKRHYKYFFHSLPHLLPCSVCAEHMLENLKTKPVEHYLDGGRESLFKWSVEFHNLVNTQTGKPEWSIDDAFILWKKICIGNLGDCNISSVDPRIAYFLWLVLAIFMFIFLWMVVQWLFFKMGRRPLKA
jgi:hypothetical protein